MSYAATQPRTKRYSPLPRKPRAVDPAGRVDLLAARLLMRGIENFERRRNIPGLAAELRPVVEGLVTEMLPSRPLFRIRRRLC